MRADATAFWNLMARPGPQSVEVEPMAPRPRVLVAGIGNIVLGDDGFGVEVAKRMAERAVPPGVTVRDFGIRGMDLAYSLRDYDAAVVIDAVPRGRAPGTLYVIDAILDAEGPPVLETHGMDPLWVLRLARELGPLPKRLLVVGCEPSVIPAPDSDVIVGRLSPPVTAAVDVAVAQVEALLNEILTSETRG